MSIKKNSENKKNKKRIIFVVALILALLTSLQSSLAYFTSSVMVYSDFKVAEFSQYSKQVFVSPNDWMPGDITKDEILIGNNGARSIAVRARISEQWIADGVGEISGTDANGNKAAIVHFNENWTLGDDGYYYYGSKGNLIELKSGEETSSIIDSVEFNRNITNAPLLVTESYSNEFLKHLYSSNTSYDNASYNLAVEFEMIQYNGGINIW